MSQQDETSGTLRYGFSNRSRLSILLIVLVFVTSCGRGAAGPIAQEQVNLAWLGHMYAMYISQNGGATPKTIDNLRKFVEKQTSAERLNNFKVTKASDLFVSPRDGKPFAMVSYDKPPAMKYGAPAPVVLYEEVGKDGERAVALLGGGTRTVDESTLKAMLPAPKRGPG